MNTELPQEYWDELADQYDHDMELYNLGEWDERHYGCYLHGHLPGGSDHSPLVWYNLIMLTTNQKLSEISRIMADGFHFVMMRDLMEKMERAQDKESAQEILEMVDHFHRLCVYVERKGTDKWETLQWPSTWPGIW